MNYSLIFGLLSTCILPVNSKFTSVEKNIVSPNYLSFVSNDNRGTQQDPVSEKMTAVEFRSQEYCRVELKDFEWEVYYRIVGATVYFSGTNFKNVEKAVITSSDLKPIKSQKARCAPGTIVVFDDIKVVGPDKEVRTIQG